MTRGRSIGLTGTVLLMMLTASSSATVLLNDDPETIMLTWQVKPGHEAEAQAQAVNRIRTGNGIRISVSPEGHRKSAGCARMFYGR